MLSIALTLSFVSEIQSTILNRKTKIKDITKDDIKVATTTSIIVKAFILFIFLLPQIAIKTILLFLFIF
jgi:hypothetical protein